jgi:excisionase family DNA binding protein
MVSLRTRGWPGIGRAFGRPETHRMDTTDTSSSSAAAAAASSASSSSNGLAPRIGRSVSLDHAAQILGVSRRTIYNRIRDGRLQTIRTLGGSQRVLIDSVRDSRSLR